MTSPYPRRSFLRRAGRTAGGSERCPSDEGRAAGGGDAATTPQAAHQTKELHKTSRMDAATAPQPTELPTRPRTPRLNLRHRHLHLHDVLREACVRSADLLRHRVGEQVVVTGLGAATIPSPTTAGGSAISISPAFFAISVAIGPGCTLRTVVPCFSSRDAAPGDGIGGRLRRAVLAKPAGRRPAMTKPIPRRSFLRRAGRTAGGSERRPSDEGRAAGGGDAATTPQAARQTKELHKTSPHGCGDGTTTPRPPHASPHLPSQSQGQRGGNHAGHSGRRSGSACPPDHPLWRHRLPCRVRCCGRSARSLHRLPGEGADPGKTGRNPRGSAGMRSGTFDLGAVRSARKAPISGRCGPNAARSAECSWHARPHSNCKAPSASE